MDNAPVALLIAANEVAIVPGPVRPDLRTLPMSLIVLVPLSNVLDFRRLENRFFNCTVAVVTGLCPQSTLFNQLLTRLVFPNERSQELYLCTDYLTLV